MTPTALFKLADNGNATSWASRLRARRFRLFLDMLAGLPDHPTILDVGGTPGMWLRHQTELPRGIQVTLLNSEPLSEQPATIHPWLTRIQADARDLSRFPDKHFDLCFSNSLIEHFSSFEQQQQVAQGIQRIAKGYFVQTPNRYFPIEPHFLIPGWQFLPVALRTTLLQKKDLGWMKQLPNEAEAREAVESIRLLTKREMRQLFPDAQIHRETAGPLTKSLIAKRSAR